MCHLNTILCMTCGACVQVVLCSNHGEEALIRNSDTIRRTGIGLHQADV